MLAKCEHFDIVFVPFSKINDHNFLTLCDLSDFVCVFYDNHAELLHITNYASGAQKTNIVYSSDTSEKKICVIKTDRTNLLQRRNILWCLPSNKEHKIISTFDDKYLIKEQILSQVLPEQQIISKNTIQSPWIPGINLLTFIYFGIYLPDQKSLIAHINRLKEIPHPDWGPSNMIIAGDKLSMIDFQDFHYDLKKVDDTVEDVAQRDFRDRRCKKLFKMFNMGQKEMLEYYWRTYHSSLNLLPFSMNLLPFSTQNEFVYNK